MKKAIIGAVSALAAIALLAGFAGKMEHRDPEHAHEFMNRRVEKLLNEINATDAQRAQINQIKDQLWQQGVALHESHAGLRKELMTQWQNPQIDAAKIHAMVDQRVDEFRAVAQKAADGAIQLHEVLTPEQRAQLEKELQAHHRHEDR